MVDQAQKAQITTKAAPSLTLKLRSVILYSSIIEVTNVTLRSGD